MKKFWVIILFFGLSTPAIAKDSEASAIMKGMYESIEVLIPYSLSTDEFAAVSNRSKMQDELNKFAIKSEVLSDHFKIIRQDLFFLGYGLSQDAKDAAELYKAGNYEQSRFVLHHVSDSCVTCHSKAQSQDKKDGGKIFFSNIKNFKLTGFDLANYQTMSRQFDAALNKFEQTFLAEKFYLNSTAFGSYLKVALRVKNDPVRVEKFLLKLKNHVPAGSRLYDHVVYWHESAKDIVNNKLRAKSDLKSARRLIDRGDKIQGYYHDSASIVYYVAASALLLTKLESNKDKDELAEIFYLLGEIEDKMPDDFWISETEMYLEQSIRVAPQSKFGGKSLGLLEDRFLFNYTGSSGTHLPDDLKKNLKELRDLVHSKKKG